MGGDASGIRAGRAYVDLYGNDDGLTDVLNRAEGMIGAWSARLKGAGSAVASTFGAAITSVVSTVAAAGAATVALGSAGLAVPGLRRARWKSSRLSILCDRWERVPGTSFRRVSAAGVWRFVGSAAWSVCWLLKFSHWRRSFRKWPGKYRRSPTRHNARRQRRRRCQPASRKGGSVNLLPI